ncbi:MAG: alkyl sulfatase dimerization domain-containing protein [Pseudomonadales bacterium]
MEGLLPDTMPEHTQHEPPFEPRPPATGPQGQLVHPAALDQLTRLTPRLYHVGEHAWCLVGNGLSNQSFVRAPEGIIAIDTGDCVEEMQAALSELRKVTDLPVVACIYTHFHYVNGTQALLTEHPHQERSTFAIYGHADIDRNRARFGGEIAPRSNKGIVHQFGTQLPSEGEDALLHCGLGLHLRNPDHAPFTPGYVAANHLIDTQQTTQVAGLEVQLSPAPADTDDSLTIWFPQLNLCINNLFWPALFNIYAIRGEQYRDPQTLLQGMDHIIQLQPAQLIGTHGPPLQDLNDHAPLIAYRDSIQFLWDQTVRRLNLGDTMDEAAHNVQLPAHLGQTYLTGQFYGVAEHHVKQIHAGLFGWFDGDESQLFPLPTSERNDRLIAGFGGREVVHQQASDALAQGDLRWALELATWLVRSTAVSAQDRTLLAAVLRQLAQHTISANVRNWSLTRALDLEGSLDLKRHHQHRFSARQVLGESPTRFIPVLRVLLVPDRAVDVNTEVAWHFASGERCGLLVRNQVAIATSGEDADLTLGLSHETWADVLSGQRNLWQCVDEGLVSVSGDSDQLARFCSAFDIPGLQR